jgi:hypothetical protein
MGWVITCDRARIPVSTQVLTGIKAKASEPAGSAGVNAIPLRPVRLGSIFDDCEPVPISQFLEI